MLVRYRGLFFVLDETRFRSHGSIRDEGEGYEKKGHEKGDNEEVEQQISTKD